MPITAFLAAVWAVLFLLLIVFSRNPGTVASWLATAIVWITLLGIVVMLLEAIGALRGLARLLFGRR
jgi:ABC-type Mn2+/Zn2+ transport system permease subunit